MSEQKNIAGNIFDFKVLKRVFGFVKPYRLKFYILLLVTVVIGFLFPLLPFIIQKTIDGPIANGKVREIGSMLSLMLVFIVFRTFLQYYHSFLSGWLGQSVIKDIRVKLYDHILKLKLRFYDQTPIGQLVTRNISDIETLSEIFTQGVASIFGDFLQLIFILIIMFSTDWRLALISICTLPILLYGTYIFKEKIKVAFNQVRNAVSNLNTFVQEHISGMSIVQIFNAERREHEKFQEINKTHTTANVKTVLYYSIYFPLAEIVGAIGIGLLVWYGAIGILENSSKQGLFSIFSDVQEPITKGTLIAFIMYIGMFFRPIRMMADRFNTLQMGVVSSKRILDLLDSEEIIPNEGTFVPDTIQGDIEFQQVQFAYDEVTTVLNNISFKAKAGSVVAFVGATGAGKTSIINLISRFYEIQSGTILIDGTDVKDYDLGGLRKYVGVVLQDVFLFSGSIADNISLGNTSISEEKMWEAARLVGADQFIEKLPGKMQYEVKERGATLSVGQRQLISFVRTMVYNPKVLILDEATSSVDTETEEMIQFAIDRMLKGRTTLVIAHRLSTIQKAENIIVLDKGEIKEQGTHAELLHQKGFYHELHEMQFTEN